jgi:ABC-type glycerol-3-phosphate transport system substrate-binding protein
MAESSAPQGRGRRAGGSGEPAPRTSRTARRRLLRAVAALGAALAGCAGPRQATGPATPQPAGVPVTARPTSIGGRTPLTFQPWQDAYGFQGLKSLNAILFDATGPFRAAHPGVDLRFWGPEINPIASVLAGQGPDVPQLQGGSGGIAAWLAGPYVLDLTPYIRQSNVDLGNFAAGQVADVTLGRGIYGIPNYTGTAGMVVNLSTLDALGLPYPPKPWTYREWEQLARAAARGSGSGTRLRGTTINADYFGRGPGAMYYAGWGASIVAPEDPARCGLDSDAAIACGEFLYQLVWDGVADFGWVPSDFVRGGTVAPFCWLQSYILPAATQWTGFKWDFWPMPTWPKGPATMTNPNFFAISVAARDPDLAWELVHWLTVEPDWQRTLMRTVLLPPGYLPLWEEWLTVVRQVAPTLAHKDLEVFAAHIRDGIMYGGTHFAYQDPQAKRILGQWYAQIAGRTVSVREGLGQAARQINALQASARAAEPRARAARQRFPTRGPDLAPVPPGI